MTGRVPGVAEVPAEVAPPGLAGRGGKLATLALGFVMATLDATVVNVAGATIGRHLRLGVAGVTWVVDGYVLTFAALLLLAGSLAVRFGARRVYLAGLGVFTVASLACALAPDGAALIAARLVQGTGAAMFMPASLGLLAGVFPEPKLRARALGLWTAIVSTASGLGPVLGGVLVGVANWRAIFLLNVPIGIAALALTVRLIPSPPGRPAPLGVASHAVAVLALGALSYALIEGPARGWDGPPILVAFGLALAGAVAFPVGQRRSRNPVVPVHLFGDRQFTSANVIGFLLNFALFGGVFMLGLFLQYGRGAGPLRAGVELLPMMIVFVLGNLSFARMTRRFGVRTPLVVALACAAVGTLTLLLLHPSMPYALLAVLMAAANFGVGVTVPALTATLMEAAGRENANLAGATLTANRQVGALVGVAATGAILTGAHSFAQGAHWSFLMMSAAYFTACLIAWRYIWLPSRHQNNPAT